MKKKNWKLAAETKTIADYALILEHCNGYDKKDCVRLATESEGETLFELLRQRNEKLFRTGSIVMMNDAQRTERRTERRNEDAMKNRSWSNKTSNKMTNNL